MQIRFFQIKMMFSNTFLASTIKISQKQKLIYENQRVWGIGTLLKADVNKY